MSEYNYYFKEQGRSIFVRWNPKGSNRLHHHVWTLSSGGFEVQCCHKIYDEDNIRAQIKHIITSQNIAKKNN